MASDIGEEHEIIVVDNASSDATVELVRKEFPDIDLVPLTENVGFGRGCNVGAERARGEFLLLLNPDSIVFPDSIQRLLQFAREFPDAGIWGGEEIREDGTVVGRSCWHFPSLWSTLCNVSGLSTIFDGSRLFSDDACVGREGSAAISADVVGGFFLLIRDDLWKALGGFDPIYFLYSEEEDLCVRAASLGAKPKLSRRAKIVHNPGGTQPMRAERLVMLLKGKCTYMRKHWPRWKAALGSALLCLWPLTRWLAFAVAGRVTSDAGRLTAAKTWREVWNRRTEWLQGWPDPERRSATS